MKTPNRPPDFTSKSGVKYWFMEGIEDALGDLYTFYIKDGIIHYINNRMFAVLPVCSILGEQVYPAYKKWLISTCLKEKLNDN